MRRFATATALAMIALLIGSAWFVDRLPTRGTHMLAQRDAAQQDATDPAHQAPSDPRRRQATQVDAHTDTAGWPVATAPVRQGLSRFYPPLRVQFIDGDGVPDMKMWAALNPSESNLAHSRQRTEVTFAQPGHLVLHRPSSVSLTVVAQDETGVADNTLSSSGGPLLFELQTAPEGAAVPRTGATPAPDGTHVWSRVEPGLYRICARSPRIPGYGEVAAIEGVIVPIGRPCTDSRLVQWDPYRETDLAILDVVLADGTRPDGCYVAIVVDGVSRTRRNFDLSAGPVEVAIPRDEACLLSISADGMRQTIIGGLAGSHRIVLQPGMPATVIDISVDAPITAEDD